MEYVLVILTILAPFAIYIYIFTSQRKKLDTVKQELQAQLHDIHGFVSTQSVISINGKTALGVDERRNLLALLRYNNDKSITYRVISAADLIGVEVYEKGKSVSEIQNSAIKGALVGGLFGTAGAIIGANSAGSRATSEVDSISLILTVNDLQYPNHVIFFRTRSHSNYRAPTEAHHWFSILEIMVHRAESGQSSPIIRGETFPLRPEMKGTSDFYSLPPAKGQSDRFSRCELRSAVAVHSYPIRIAHDTFSIGRAATNDLILQDTTVSRQHALLHYVNHAWMIQDQNSTAGLYVNGKRVSQQILKTGDRIKIGSNVFIFTENK